MRAVGCALESEPPEASRWIVLAHDFIDHCGMLDDHVLTDCTPVKSPVRSPRSFYIVEIFKIRHGMICQIEANFIAEPYHMKGPWDGK